MEEIGSSEPKKKEVGIFQVALIVIIVGAIIGAAVYFFMQNNKEEQKDEEQYQAVFLINGQVYFGKTESKTERELVFKDVYYLQANQPLQQATEGEEGSEEQTQEQPQPELSLVKLGNEIHGPEDQMEINRDQILFVETLKDDSKVVEAIKNYKE